MKKIAHITRVFIPSLVLVFSSNNILAQEQSDGPGSSILPEISAYYTIDVVQNNPENNSNYSKNILVWRDHNLFEIQHLDSSFGEYWELLKRGRVKYSWIHHNRDFIVEHEPTFLNSPKAGLAFWESKATFFNMELLTELSKTEGSTFQGYPSEKYEGELNGEKIVVRWLPSLSLPVSISQKRKDDSYTITLQELYLLDDSPLIPINTEEYKDIDYVDFEEEPNDPDVQFYQSVLNEEAHNH